MDADLDTLATALYVSADDLLRAHPERVPPRPRVGIAPKISDAELITQAVMQALLGYTSETRWLRHARNNLLARPRRSTDYSSTSAAPPSASATSPTTPPDHSWRPAATDPGYTLKREESLYLASFPTALPDISRGIRIKAS